MTRWSPELPKGDIFGKSRLLPQGKCPEERERRLQIISRGDVQDVVAPECTVTGYWKVEQFDGEGRHRCVNPLDGKFVIDGNDQDTLVCGDCYKEMERLLQKPSTPVIVLPRCDEKGRFLPKQNDNFRL